MNAADILKLYKNSENDALIAAADEVCRNVYGSKVYLRGLIEFSNICNIDCLYCGIRKSNKEVKRYRLSEDEIIDTVSSGTKYGFKTFVLQGGEDPYFTTPVLCGLVEKIKKINPEAAVTLSAGIRSCESYRLLKEAGCDRYLLRFETSDPELHKYLRNGVTLNERLKALDNLRKYDYEVGSGFMVGLPGETEETRIQNALLCRDYNFDMVGIGPFIPHPSTPLADALQMPLELAIRSVALVRLFLPEANIPATTAAGSLSSAGRERMLAAGANVLMPNITPVKYKKDYELYPGKICLDESGFECAGCLEGRVLSVNKFITYERGDSAGFLHGKSAVS
ncbi:MAG: [FeFe] hydrogenase H-cluster radical SAM maturase HydE [Spirochaetes bacterium]|nr:[FeFe] hydrogenase H-cluster radical SAM maturase HydE [Spirochaetota bacterium]